MVALLQTLAVSARAAIPLRRIAIAIPVRPDIHRLVLTDIPIRLIKNALVDPLTVRNVISVTLRRHGNISEKQHRGIRQRVGRMMNNGGLFAKLRLIV